ncbi:MAG: GAF domain-containing protein [Nitrospirae bacterium]|nr:GAF domain-containing protein [Nitrospirota bacterium]
MKGFDPDKFDSAAILKIIMGYLPTLIRVPDHDTMVRQLTSMGRDIVDAERCSLWFADYDKNEIYTEVADGIGQIRMPLKTGLVGYAMSHEHPVISNDVYSDERFYREVDLQTGYKTANLMAIPLRSSEDEIIGAVEVVNKKGGADFTESDLMLLFVTASITGRMLESFNTQDVLKTIFRFATRIANEINVNKLLLLLADFARDLLNADRCTLWLSDLERRELWTIVAHGVSSLRMPLHSGFAGYAVTNNTPVISNDPLKDPRFNPEVDKVTGYSTESIIAIPIRTIQNDVLGAMQCINKKSLSKKFKETDIEKLFLVGEYAAQTLEVTGLYKEIEDTQKEIVLTLGTACEFRSKETSNHVKRVAEYSKLLALEYGLEVEEVEVIKQASPLHDIGKIAIPDSILNKPGPLTVDEYEIMKTHAQIGFDMLCVSKRKILETAAIIAGEHHEKWDGTGYPKGKAGEEIHICGRISALADVFDALGSDRCYKNAWEIDKILKLFEEERGKHFEPKLVDIFFRNIDALLFLREQFKD